MENMPGMSSSMSMAPEMTMPSSAASTVSSSPSSVSTVGMNMSNETVQMDLLMDILYDTELQVTSNSYATRFWYGVIVVIGIAVAFNLFLRMISRSRLRAAAANQSASTPSLEATSQLVGGAAAKFRSVTYPQVSPIQHSNIFRLPPFGIVILILVYVGFVLGLEFVSQNVPGLQHRQAIGVRAGWLTITQLPLLILLAGKANLIGFFTGVTYERLNVLHRWVARTMLLTATIHMGTQQALWSSLGLLQLEWSTDTCPPTGIKAYAFLVWMNLSTLAPIRNFWYEFFIIQHILTFFGFIICIMLHLPPTAIYSRVYIWIPIGLYILDRLIRTSRYAWINIRPGRATLVREHGGVTKIIVKNRQIKKWTPGSFVLLSLPRFGIMQSHPATISSIPSSPSSHEGVLVFILSAHHGFTTRVFAGASTASLSSMDSQKAAEAEPAAKKSSTHLALIDGPYGGTHLDFASFNTVILIAGSTGVTFTLPVLMDISSRAQRTKLPIREVVFVWAVKTAGCKNWIANELKQAEEELVVAGVGLSLRIHVTADEGFVEESEGDGSGSQGCQCEGECSCISNSSPPASSSENNEKTKIREREEKKIESITHQKQDKNPSIYQSRTPNTTIQAGRPNIHAILAELQSRATGEMGVAVCGPVGLAASTRRSVASLQGKQRGIYLHAESFGW